MANKPGNRDFRDLRREGDTSRPIGLSDASNRRDWWRLEGRDCAAAIRSTLEQLQKQQDSRMRQAVISARLYGNVYLRGAAGSAEARLLAAQHAMRDRMTYNAVQSIIDTVVSRVGETKPRPFYLTDGGNYAEQRKAKKLNKYVEGVFYANRAYDVGLKSFRDGAIWGDGFLHVFARGGRVVIERTICTELWVDEVEAQYGNPRRLHWVRTVDREELLAYFADDKKACEAIKNVSRVNEKGTANDVSDVVKVCESWNLAAADEDGEMVGGAHAISLVDGGEMLVEPEDYPFDFFPFARVPWCERPLGYWSQGLCEQLQGDQISLNKKLWLIERSMQLAGSFKILLKNGSKVVKEQLNNEVGSIVNWAGDAPPQYITPQPIHEMYLMEVEREISRMYQKAGISELAAKSTKPAGLNSGKAIREFNDTESDRFRTIQRQNDNLYLELARLVVEVSKEAAQAGKLKPVSVPGARNVELIDFKRDIGDLRMESYVLQCFPVSRLPKDPSGRLQTIQEYIQAGFMTPRQGRRALDFPDLDSIESLANAQEDMLCKTLDAIADDGEYAPPEPTDDLILAKEMVIEYIQRGRASGLEEDRLQMLRDWSAQVDAMTQLVAKQAQSIAAPPMPGASTSTAPAAPLPPPTSDLLPNAVTH